jgi:hypothetical protein
MKTSAFFLIALSLCSSNNLRGAEPWKEQPLLRALRLSVFTTMDEYESWAEDWRKAKRSPTDSDRSMNLMAETTFLTIQMALEDHPNPLILEKCLIFFGTTVPSEFDHLWNARILEMADVDQAITKKVNDMLKSKNLPSLEKRAMGRE